MLVVDASAVTELLLARPAAEQVAREIVAHGHDLHAPHLLDIEVLNALRRVVASGEATADRAGEAVADLMDLSVERYPHDGIAHRIWELRENFSAYDAAYLALAEAVAEHGATLLTADIRFARAVEAHSGVGVLRVG